MSCQLQYRTESIMVIYNKDKVRGGNSKFNMNQKVDVATKNLMTTNFQLQDK